MKLLAREGYATHRSDPFLKYLFSGTSLGTHRAYAAAVRSYQRPVILSFGHEMNGFWYSWGTSTPPRQLSWLPGGIS
jgi:hypothetical protein